MKLDVVKIGNNNKKKYGPINFFISHICFTSHKYVFCSKPGYSEIFSE